MEEQNTNNNRWWYEFNGQQIEVANDDAIYVLLKEGKLNAESLIWKQGMNAWIPIKHSELANNTNNLSIPPIVTNKWYNNKTKYWLSILLWPLFIYATYKTDLYKKETKNIIYIVLGIFLFAYVMTDDISNPSSGNKNLEVKFPHNMIVLGANSHMVKGSNYENGWNTNIQYTILISIDKRIFVIANNLGQEFEYNIDEISIDKDYVKVKGKIKDGNIYHQGQYFIFEVRNGALTAGFQIITQLNIKDYNVNREIIYKLTERFEY